jgi:phage tail sheath protein FI
MSDGEKRALSYGALYHPWVFQRADGSLPQVIPPDGPVSGSIAARAISRGAWVAPANEGLRAILALSPVISDQAWSRLHNEQVNMIRKEPYGFVLLSADTLSADEDLRPINVRRLLILLYRIALRRGTTLVFEPNDESLQRRVRHEFDSILSELYVRGAFAGATPQAAYQVVADSSVNTPSSLDQGRFIVELRVAPSQPTKFIVVRLVHTGGTGLSLVEG